MAIYRATELEDIHRCQPLEILEDIGIANANEVRIMAVVDELASRLNAVLGSAMKRSQRHTLPPGRVVDSYQTPQPQVYGLDSRGHIPGAGSGNAQRPSAEPQPFISNGRTLDLAVSLPRFAPAWPPPAGAVLTPAKRSGAGTRVFLLRTRAAYHHTARATRPLMNGRAESQQAVMPAKASAARRGGRGEVQAAAASSFPCPCRRDGRLRNLGAAATHEDDSCIL